MLVVTNANTNSTAPVNSQQNAENVRNATLTLADYALSESSIYSGSPSQTSIHQTNIDAYFPHDESEFGLSRTPYDPQDDVIVEVSEPTSPIVQAVSPGRKSNLTELIKRSPPSTNPSSPPKHRDSTQLQGESGRVHQEEEIPHFVITGQEVGDPLEDTPLLKKDYPNPPSEIFGNGNGREEDIESHRQPRISSWRQLGQYTQERLEEGRQVCRILANPKTWNPRAIWDTAVITPASCLPAVLLGLLLNILDALSYGIIQIH
jgi:SulP family sulfate permease